MAFEYGAGVVFEANDWYGGFVNEVDFQTLKSFGCGIVRLHAIRLWMIMPTDGVFDQAFFANYIDKYVALAQKYGMNITIDIGDWNTGSAFGGSGFPTWMTAGFTNRGDFQNAFWDLDNSTCSHQRQRFLEIWRFIADRYKNMENVGFSIYNEPLNGAGSRFGTNIHGMTDAQFSEHIGVSYSLFMEQISDVIRAAGATIQPIIVNSPFVYYLTNQKKINRDNVYWDIHLYIDVNTNFAAWTKLFEDRQDYFSSIGMPMIMGEWGIYDWVYFKSIDYKAVLAQLMDYIESRDVAFVTWLGYGAFRTNLSAQQKIDVLTIVCRPAENLITVPLDFCCPCDTACFATQVELDLHKLTHTCPAGSSFDWSTCACVMDVHVCPTGQHWDDAVQACVADVVHGGCFIATACGTNNSSLSTLRLFRDKCMPSSLVWSYYRLSPPLAYLISGHEKVKLVGRRIWEWLACQLRKTLTL